MSKSTKRFFWTLSNASNKISILLKMESTPLEILKQYFGFDQFRGRQAEVIAATLAKKDALVLMPTGGGKSICFQVPALMQPGFTVVISPLIALMKDQVDALVANGIAAAALHSALESGQESKVYEAIAQDRLKLLYLSPEKALSLDPVWWQHQKISLLAIDEAHCVSNWGHDFRPEYTQLAQLRQQMRGVPVMALTATADKTTRVDIIQQLGMQDPEEFVDSFNRSNLWLEVAPGIKPTARKLEILDYAKENPDSAGIIYCGSRKNATEVAEFLSQNGIAAGTYHAGMSPENRNEVQNQFLNDQLQVVCATIAFGMGIDKSNVRFVMHYNMPKNLESYYQEIGRAGRDGLPAFTRLYYHYGDLVMLSKFAQESAFPEVGLSKLNQMQAFAEAQICRRIILLNYFSEPLSGPCGHCDVCKNPPQKLDGTQLAQMALSAIVRADQQARLPQVIQILRGNQVADIREKGWDRLKTFGVGRHISEWLWNRYLMQMQQLGLIEIAYQEGFAIKVTNVGWEVLRNQRSVDFYEPKVPQKEDKIDAVAQKGTTEKSQTLRTLIKQKRSELAQAQGVPAYVIFNDKTLEDLLDKLPITFDDWLTVEGISAYRAENYMPHFSPLIDAHLAAKKPRPIPKGAVTHTITWELFEAGKTPEEIAMFRNLALSTVFSHLAKCLEEGLPVPVLDLVGAEDLERIKTAVLLLQEKTKLKPLFEHFNETIPYDKLRLAVTYWELEGVFSELSMPTPGGV